MFKAQVSQKAATADTVKTLVDTLTVPGGVSQIIGIWAYAVGGAGITTLQNISGIMEYESDDLSLTPLQLPLDVVVVLASGVAGWSPRIFAVAIPVSPGVSKIRGYVTLDYATTVHTYARFGFIYT
jgi:hypothetical protein